MHSSSAVFLTLLYLLWGQKRKEGRTSVGFRGSGWHTAAEWWLLWKAWHGRRNPGPVWRNIFQSWQFGERAARIVGLNCDVADLWSTCETRDRDTYTWMHADTSAPPCVTQTCGLRMQMINSFIIKWLFCLFFIDYLFNDKQQFFLETLKNLKQC